eukprot:Nk52_evm88s62 gene=Nk52_evmTU88s62
MVDVVRSNYKAMLPAIRNAIQKSAFIALDTEFTGLGNGMGRRRTPLDTMEDIYGSHREQMANILMLQVGLSMAIPDSRNPKKFKVETFNFHLFPKPVNGHDKYFMSQASSLDFLHSCGFDFNKVFGEGISFLNKFEEQKVSRRSERVFNIERPEDIAFIDKQKEVVGAWLKEASVEETMDIKRAEFNSSVQRHMCDAELRKAFPNIVTMNSNAGIYITKLDSTTSVQKKLLEIENEERERMQELLGFRQVFDFMCESGVPIVGHNCFLDFLLLYSHLIEPLPNSLPSFKAKLRTAMNSIYDTKLMAHAVLSELMLNNQTESIRTSLQNVFMQLNCKESAFSDKLPEIESSSSQDYILEGNAHDAGFDSYMTLHVFLCLKSLLEHITKSGCSEQLHMFVQSLGYSGTKEELQKCKAPADIFKNKLNMSRTEYSCLDLGTSPQPLPASEGIFCIHASSAGDKDVFKDIFQMKSLLELSVPFKFDRNGEYVLVSLARNGDRERDIEDVMAQLPNTFAYTPYDVFLTSGPAYKQPLLDLKALMTASPAFALSGAFSAGVAATLLAKKFI